ncbi:MAG TPA: DUF998 domain-containing protein [Acidimicrobiales bacterium]|nr:DUF998 domain-containing protein [Acidimicrobiales bacterium]
MTATASATRTRPNVSATRALAWGVVVGQIVFVVGWIVGGAIEGHGYSFARHDVSDLGALTAQHPALYLAICAIGGFSAIAFALGALRPALGASAAVLALSLPALDSASDTFFRLDCRAADHGCSMSDAASSWHGKAHIITFLIAALATIATPFVLARAMKARDAWRDLARPTRVFGVVFIAGLVFNGATTDTAVAGLAQRALIVYVCAGLCLLARRVLQVADGGV